MKMWNLSWPGPVKRSVAGHRARKYELLLLDSAVIVTAVSLALLMQTQGQSPGWRWPDLWAVMGAALAIKLLVFVQLGIYQISLSHLGLGDMVRILKAASLASVLFGAAALLLNAFGTVEVGVPVLVADYLLTLVLLGGIRSAKRVYSQTVRPASAAPVRRVLIAGGGSAGDLTLRAILRGQNPQCLPVGIVDDDKSKQGMTIQGVPVLGTRQDIPRLAERHSIGELLITMPSARPAVLRETVELGRRAGLKKIRVLPGFRDLIDGKMGVSDIRDLQVEDLLGREILQIDTGEIESYLTGKTVLVTGGAGSIGSELCRQVAAFQPGHLVVLDQDETGLFDLRRKLSPKLPALDLSTVIGNIRDRERTRDVFAYFRPQVVFHAAAYKHVSMMEENPREAVANNVLGTRVVGEAACHYGAKKFVLISTDKAVNPTCVMGASKRLAEILVQKLNESNSCRFVAVRFGNVLGSRGSVVPIFREQIERGGPVTVTHPEMRRYFMAPSEAALLVLQAGAIGTGGEVFVLDMGAPVVIVDLAREMIRLAGLTPDKDIPIVFTGAYPGEKLFEDILTAEEGTVASKHSRIYVAKTNACESVNGVNESLDRLQSLAEQGDDQAIIRALSQMVPAYQPGNGQHPVPMGKPLPNACPARPGG